MSSVDAVQELINTLVGQKTLKVDNKRDVTLTHPRKHSQKKTENSCHGIDVKKISKKTRVPV